MGNELVAFGQESLPKDNIEKLKKELNAEPRETFRRHTPGWPKEPLTPEKQKENELYDEWLKSLKPGDVVWYKWFQGWSGGRSFTTVKNTTKTGMIRLEDGKLVEANGRVKGESYYLQPYTEEYRTHDMRKKYLYRLNNYKYDHLTNEGLALVMKAIMQAEDMLLKRIEDER